MKTRTRAVITTCVAFFAVGIIASTAFSRGEGKFRKWGEWKQKVSSRESKKGHERQRISKEDSRKSLFKKFDKDGDGQLSHEERQNAAEFLSSREHKKGDNHHHMSKKEIIEKFDEDGDGEISREERKKVGEWHRKETD